MISKHFDVSTRLCRTASFFPIALAAADYFSLKNSKNSLAF